MLTILKILEICPGSFCPGSKGTYDKACTTYFPVLLCITKLAQILSSTTLYDKACTKYFPVLVCTTQLARSTFQDYFVLQKLHKAHYFVLHSLHKVLSSTTLHYNACTKYFPVLLCTTQLAQSTFQYYFVLQSY